MQRFKDQRAIVTGASSGIGRAIAMALAKEGSKVALAARREHLLNQVAQEIRALGREALVLPTDVTQKSQIQRLVRRVVERWGEVEILVANAGVYIRSPIKELEMGAIERSMAINFYGNMDLVLTLLPHLLERDRGKIVLMATLDAKIKLPHDTPYVVAKSALASFGDVLRQELSSTNISVTTVFPGRVDTPMIDHLKFHWISKKISPERVAQATLRGLYRGQPEVIIPWQGRVLHYLKTFFPRVGDYFIQAFHLSGWPVQSEEETTSA